MRMLLTTRYGRRHALALILVTIGSVGCGGDSSPTSPSSSGGQGSSAPSTSSLVYSVPAGATHTAASGNYTTANASFGGSVRTTCVVNPNIAGSSCPALQVLVQPFGDSFCLLTVDPPA